MLGVAFEPFAPVGHVQKQAVVLPAHHMHQVLGALLGHHMRLRHAAGHEAGLCFALRSALEHPVQRLAGGKDCPALRQGLVAQGQFVLAHGFEAGQDPHRRKPIQRPVLAAGVYATTAVENPVRI